MFKISLVVFKEGNLELHVNNELVAKDTHTLGGIQLHARDCQIGRGANNNEQFFGELFEIGMTTANRPSPTLKTLSPGFSDILFYYTFED